MSDIVERLDEPEAHYPGNFDTPKRANAMLSCLCQEAKDEIETLRQQLAEKDAEIARLKASWQSVAIEDMAKQLAASQAREVQLREALEDANDFVERHSNRWDGINGKHPCTVVESSRKALALPQDTSALEAMIAKAGEVMRERCANYVESDGCPPVRNEAGKSIRALPCVTLEDLQK